jgi:hypothetical protein
VRILATGATTGFTLATKIKALLVRAEGKTVNNTYAALAVTGFIAGMLISGCATTSEQNAANTRQELRDDRGAYRTEWQSFRNESGRIIEANEKRIDAFKEKMEIAGADTKAKYNEDVAVLEQKNRELRKKLESYKDEGRGKWVQFKTDFSQDMDGIGKTMKDLFNDSN